MAEISGQNVQEVEEGSQERFLEEAVSKFQDRRGNLVSRQQHLKDKISTMEKSIPALMAFNMWMAGQKCAGAPLCKVKEIMDTFSPIPDPTDRLVDDLKKTVKNLNLQVTDLHDKIIDADVQLEETGMELESLKLSNEELNSELSNLENEMKSTKIPSLHSINSEDLVCLTKIRQLGLEEVRLKSCVKELEDKEVIFREQMERLLTSREFQKESGGKRMARKIQELELNERKMNCSLQTHKYNMHQMKKKLMQKEKELTRIEMSLENQALANTSGTGQKVRNGRSFELGKTEWGSRSARISGKDGNVEKLEKGRGKTNSWLSRWMLSGSADEGTKKKMEKDGTCACSTTFTTDEDGKLKSCLCPTPSPNSRYEIPPRRPSYIPKPNFTPPCEPPPCKPQSISNKSHNPPPCCKSSQPSSSSCKPRRPAPSPQSCCTPLFPNPCQSSSPPRKPGSRHSSACPTLPCNQKLFCEAPASTECPGVVSGPRAPSPCAPTPCKECSPVLELSGCRCSCRGSCARGENEVPCNCSVTGTCSADGGYQPQGLPKAPCHPDGGCWLEEESSDEYCDCCDCGCNDSDDSDFRET